MPEIVDSLRAAEEARAIDHVGTAIEQGLEKFAVVARIVFEVGVLDENDVAGNFGEAAAECCAFALIVVLKKDAQVTERDEVGPVLSGSGGFAGVLQLDKFFEDLPGTVGGAEESVTVERRGVKEEGIRRRGPYGVGR